MKRVSFYYDGARIWLINFIICIVILGLFSTIFLIKDPPGAIIFIIASTVVFIGARFFIINFSLPLFKGKTALIIDEEKITSFVSDVTIYWKNVDKVRKYGFYEEYFLFETKDGEIYRIGTKWVDGSANLINRLIQEFMSKSVNEDNSRNS